MQKAVPEGRGSMVAVIGMTSKIVNELIVISNCDSRLIQVANDNDPSQVVISGEKEEVQKFTMFLKQKNAKKIIDLPVSAPFHSPLMKEAAFKNSLFSFVALNAMPLGIRKFLPKPCLTCTVSPIFPSLLIFCSNIISITDLT
jgi:malonyl CoA-acyl carrier protein transacylase